MEIKFEIKAGLIDWLKTKELKDTTIKDYMFYFDKFKGEFNQVNVDEFLIDYNNIVARAFLKNLKEYLIEHPSGDMNDILNVKFPKITGRRKKSLPKIISKDEVYLIEDKMPSEKFKLMLLLSYFGGLRIGGLLGTKEQGELIGGVKVKDFNWYTWKKDKSKMGELRVYEKGGKEGIAIVHPQLMERIMNWINEEASDKIINNKIIFDRSKRRWQQILSQVSLKAIGKSISPHVLRHSIASDMLKKGVDIRYIKDFLILPC